MTRQNSTSQSPRGAGNAAAAVPLISGLWAVGYLAINLIVWAESRATLVSTILISLPMVTSATALTMVLDRLRREYLHMDLSVVTTLLLPAVFAAAALQGLADGLSVRLGAALLFPDLEGHPLIEQGQLAVTVFIYALQFFCCLLTLALLHAMQILEIMGEHKAKAISAQRNAEEKALRLQLTPHFLFNALNSIAALVAHDGNKVADTMICRLSEFLRATLAVDPEDGVSLESELATAKSYLAIERLRFGERLSVGFNIAPDAWGAAIPPLLLQPLVENAVKHSLATTRTTIWLTINARRKQDSLVITVTDTRLSGGSAPTKARTESTGIGLSNIQKRLQLIDRKRARLETEKLSNGFRATLTLPYRRFSRTAPDHMSAANHGASREVHP